MYAFELTPAGANSPAVYLFVNALAPVPRAQPHDTANDSTVDSSPYVEVKGPLGGGVTFKGAWLGPEADDIGTEFDEEFLRAPSVDKIDVQAKDSNGNDVQNRYNGRYAFNSEPTETRPVHPTETRIWLYTINLTEA